MTKRLTAWMILASASAGGCVARPTPPATGTADDSPHYNLTAKLFPLDRRLEVSGTIQLPAADTSRGQITLSLTERMRDFRVEVVQPLSHAGPVAMQRVAENRGSVKWVLRPANPFHPTSEGFAGFALAHETPDDPHDRVRSALRWQTHSSVPKIDLGVVEMTSEK